MAGPIVLRTSDVFYAEQPKAAASLITVEPERFGGFLETRPVHRASRPLPVLVDRLRERHC